MAVLYTAEIRPLLRAEAGLTPISACLHLRHRSPAYVSRGSRLRLRPGSPSASSPRGTVSKSPSDADLSNLPAGIGSWWRPAAHGGHGSGDGCIYMFLCLRVWVVGMGRCVE